jgi:hypothetical protein
VHRKYPAHVIARRRFLKKNARRIGLAVAEGAGAAGSAFQAFLTA